MTNGGAAISIANGIYERASIYRSSWCEGNHNHVVELGLDSAAFQLYWKEQGENRDNMYKERRWLLLYRGRSPYLPSSNGPANSTEEGEVCPLNEILGINSTTNKYKRNKKPDFTKKTIVKGRLSQLAEDIIHWFNTLRGQERDPWVVSTAVRAVSAQRLLCVPQGRRSVSRCSSGTTSNVGWTSVNHALWIRS